MLACVDVDYRDDHAVAACVLFTSWVDASPVAELVERVGPVEDYSPGEFYKRELPCLLAVLTRAPAVEVVIVDGYVWLGKDRPGLGARLYDAIAGRAPVVGVAKTAYAGNDAAVPVLRGQSAKPLFVTAVGMDLTAACDGIRTMHGAHRIPTLLGRVDRLSRE